MEHDDTDISIESRMEPGTGKMARESREREGVVAASTLSMAISLKRIADTLDSVLTNGTSDDLYGLAIRTSDTPGR